MPEKDPTTYSLITYAWITALSSWGGIVGWLASLIMKRDAQQGIILNVVVGIVGALLAGWIFGGGINEAITIRTFLFSIVGAVILLAIVNLFSRGKLR